MAQSAVGSISQPISLPVIPLAELLPWAVFGGLVMLLASFSILLLLNLLQRRMGGRTR